jgi:hypothetical protein
VEEMPRPECALDFRDQRVCFSALDHARHPNPGTTPKEIERQAGNRRHRRAVRVDLFAVAPRTLCWRLPLAGGCACRKPGFPVVGLSGWRHWWVPSAWRWGLRSFVTEMLVIAQGVAMPSTAEATGWAAWLPVAVGEGARRGWAR